MSYISEQTRRLVGQRAEFRCEYCKVREIDTFIAFGIDHIISQKHGGGNELDNLAFACQHCNAHKGSDITTILDSYQDIVTLFNPRSQNWGDHFYSKSGKILGFTKIGTATVKLLQMNDPDRIIQRALLESAGCWPD